MTPAEYREHFGSIAFGKEKRPPVTGNSTEA
jgi:hypothetical protein